MGTLPRPTGVPLSWPQVTDESPPLTSYASFWINLIIYRGNGGNIVTELRPIREDRALWCPHKLRPVPRPPLPPMAPCLELSA